MVSIDLLQEMSLQALFRTDGLFAVVTGGGSVRFALPLRNERVPLFVGTRFPQHVLKSG